MSRKILQLISGYNIEDFPENMRRAAICSDYITSIVERPPNSPKISGQTYVYLAGHDDPFIVWETYDEVLDMWTEALSG